MALMLDTVYRADVWQVEALTAFIKDLASKGLSGLYAKREENVPLASQAIIDVCERLGELNALPNDVEKDILAFFQKSTCKEFSTYVQGLITDKMKVDVKRPGFGRGMNNRALIH